MTAGKDWNEREELSRPQFFIRWLWRGFAISIIAVLVIALLSLAYFSWEFCEVCYQFHFEFSAVELSVFSIAGVLLGLIPTYHGIWHSQLPRGATSRVDHGILAWALGALVIIPIILVYVALEFVSSPHPA